ncbi:type II secretion system protein N [Sphingobium scionense]|uniref:General secretion pathway protein C n=1 Tax=Sphingobium scionense TaxID=1404341 RepID=A0A7W6LMC2_9SPHN|nr:type II secretion system protein N [Sphingobium scionense]MBB4147031.1 general secretion pathway protein C [Sphingobium scionense]
MRVPFGDKLQGWRRYARPVDWLGLVEKLLLAMLALQLARLIWVLLTPVGAFGPWEGRQAQLLSASARQALFASFDPFFRTGAPQAGNGVVTSLALTLYGVRLNEGTGQGSAILATPDGIQNSYAVGDEIMPGVVLKAVSFDHVTIDRGGVEEQVFLDQSQTAPAIGGPADGPGSAPEGEVAPSPVPGRDAPSADAVKRDIGFFPRTQNGRVTGLVLSPRGPGFQYAGFQAGDIVTQINGQPIGSAGDLASLQNQIVPGARLSLTVERGAVTVPINLILQGQ